jgi:hypothetical protein
MVSYPLIELKLIIMNSAFIRILFVLTLLAGSFSANSHDYFITTKNDTIKGEIRMLTFGQVDQLVTTINGKKKTYKAMDVKFLSYGGTAYKPMSYENSIHFFQILTPGYVSYYAFRPANQMTYSGRYLAKLDGRGIEVPGIGFKKIMSNFMSDCPEIVENIKSEKLGRNDLELIIADYNKCIESKTAAAYVSPATIETDNTKLDGIKNLQAKVNSLGDLTSKKDITDLLSDMADKISKHQSIPNYQIEALKGLLKDNKDTKDQLDKVIALLSTN